MSSRIDSSLSDVCSSQGTGTTHTCGTMDPGGWRWVDLCHGYLLRLADELQQKCSGEYAVVWPGCEMKLCHGPSVFQHFGLGIVDVDDATDEGCFGLIQLDLLVGLGGHFPSIVEAYVLGVATAL